MSLDVYLTPKRPAGAAQVTRLIPIRQDGRLRMITRAEWDELFPGRVPLGFVGEEPEGYWDNITHNLGPMALEAGLYEALWRPEDNGFKTAAQLIPILTLGLANLRADPERFRRSEPGNGWGTYEQLVTFVEGYLHACEADPEASVRASR